jgi:dTDP-4-amino-4,6-dideoxygalactose transaminase
VKPIYVTEPFLPPLNEYVAHLEEIWGRNVLTNQGPLVNELEQSIQSYHGIQANVHCVANGGLGLQIVLKALGVTGEVVTTPLSYVATTSCPLWEGCSIKFADIDPDRLTIDPDAVESVIGPNTEAIVATHVYGNPCDCETLEAISNKHGIALIYDAAHAFGVAYQEKSILEYGDASMVSLHSTKLLHAVEGGFVVASDPAVAEKVEWMRRFGHQDNGAFHGVGINAKLSELHAAMGLCNLKYVEKIIRKRNVICDVYDEAIGDDDALSTIKYRQGATRNYSYYPVIFDSEASLLAAMARFNEANIFPRRYFYPDLSTFFSQSAVNCPRSIDISRRILCLPLAESMDHSATDRVVTALRAS